MERPLEVISPGWEERSQRKALSNVCTSILTPDGSQLIVGTVSLLFVRLGHVILFTIVRKLVRWHNKENSKRSKKQFEVKRHKVE